MIFLQYVRGFTKESENRQENFSNPTEDAVGEGLRRDDDGYKKKEKQVYFLVSLLIISVLADKIH